MKRRFETYEELVAFAERTRTPYKRVSLVSTWKKWRKGARGHAKTCDHEGTVREWDCYCSFGCDCCHLGAECTACNSKFTNTRDTPMTVEVFLSDAA